MDALKRAEKARRERLERERREGTPGETQELSLESIEEARRDAPPAADGPPPPAAQPGAQPPEAAPPAAAEDAAEEAGGIAGAEEEEEDDDDEGPRLELVGEDELQLEDASATLPSLKTARASVDEYFEQEVPSLEDIRLDERDDDTVTSRRADARRSAQESARVVFDAKAPRVAGRGQVWVVIAVVALLVAGVAAGGYYYWMTIASQPSLVVRGTHTGAPAARPSAAPAPAAPAAPSLSADAARRAAPQPSPGAGDARAAAGDARPPAAGAAQTAAVPETGAPETRAAEAAAPETGTPEAGAPEAGAVMPPHAPPEPPAQAAAAAPAPADLPVPAPGDAAAPSAGGIRIASKRTADRLHPKLQAAYAAFRRGDDEAAQAAYRQVLASEPDNRDALLGLGAIAMRQGREGDAAERYLRVLELHPRDSVAQAALISLRAYPDPGAGETRLKLLLEREPDADYLYFCLGNLYAAQSRWPEAQQAYFDAYRGDDGNADYALNLAVSLDHMGQRDAALRYYRRALELSDRRRAGFEPAAVLARIRDLTDASGAR